MSSRSVLQLDVDEEDRSVRQKKKGPVLPDPFHSRGEINFSSIAIRGENLPSRFLQKEMSISTAHMIKSELSNTCTMAS